MSSQRGSTIWWQGIGEAISQNGGLLVFLASLVGLPLSGQPSDVTALFVCVFWVFGAWHFVLPRLQNWLAVESSVTQPQFDYLGLSDHDELSTLVGREGAKEGFRKYIQKQWGSEDKPEEKGPWQSAFEEARKNWSSGATTVEEEARALREHCGVLVDAVVSWESWLVDDVKWLECLVASRYWKQPIVLKCIEAGDVTGAMAYVLASRLTLGDEPEQIRRLLSVLLGRRHPEISLNFKGLPPSVQETIHKTIPLKSIAVEPDRVQLCGGVILKDLPLRGKRIWDVRFLRPVRHFPPPHIILRGDAHRQTWWFTRRVSFCILIGVVLFCGSVYEARQHSHVVGRVKIGGQSDLYGTVVEVCGSKWWTPCLMKGAWRPTSLAEVELGRVLASSLGNAFVDVELPEGRGPLVGWYDHVTSPSKGDRTKSRDGEKRLMGLSMPETQVMSQRAVWYDLAAIKAYPNEDSGRHDPDDEVQDRIDAHARLIDGVINRSGRYGVRLSPGEFGLSMTEWAAYYSGWSDSWVRDTFAQLNAIVVGNQETGTGENVTLGQRCRIERNLEEVQVLQVAIMATRLYTVFVEAEHPDLVVGFGEVVPPDAVPGLNCALEAFVANPLQLSPILRPSNSTIIGVSEFHSLLRKLNPYHPLVEAFLATLYRDLWRHNRIGGEEVYGPPSLMSLTGEQAVRGRFHWRAVYEILHARNYFKGQGQVELSLDEWLKRLKERMEELTLLDVTGLKNFEEELRSSGSLPPETRDQRLINGTDLLAPELSQLLRRGDVKSINLRYRLAVMHASFAELQSRPLSLDMTSALRAWTEGSQLNEMPLDGIEHKAYVQWMAAEAFASWSGSPEVFGMMQKSELVDGEEFLPYLILGEAAGARFDVPVDMAGDNGLHSSLGSGWKASWIAGSRSQDLLLLSKSYIARALEGENQFGSIPGSGEVGWFFRKEEGEGQALFYRLVGSDAPTLRLFLQTSGEYARLIGHSTCSDRDTAVEAVESCRSPAELVKCLSDAVKSESEELKRVTLGLNSRPTLEGVDADDARDILHRNRRKAWRYLMTQYVLGALEEAPKGTLRALIEDWTNPRDGDPHGLRLEVLAAVIAHTRIDNQQAAREALSDINFNELARNRDPYIRQVGRAWQEPWFFVLRDRP